MQTLTEIAGLLSSPVAMIFKSFAPNKVMGYGLAIPSLTMFLIPLGIEQFGIPSYSWLIVNRAIFGFCHGLWLSGIGGIIGDFTAEDNRGRTFGIIEFSWALSDFLMPLIGVLLHYYPVSVVYYAQGVIALIVAAGLLLVFPKRARRENRTTSTALCEITPYVEQRDDVERPSRISIKESITNYWSLLWNPSSISMFLNALLFSSQMIIFSFFGIWLKNEYGYTSGQVGGAYFITYTLSGVVTFMWAILCSDRVGLMRSANLSVIFLVFPFGLIFTFMSTSLSPQGCLWLLFFFMIGKEGNLVFLMGYVTTKEFSPNPLLMFSLFRTGHAIGHVIFVFVCPHLYSYYGELLGTSEISNSFGLFVATSTLFITSGTISFIIGRRCDKRVHYDALVC